MNADDKIVLGGFALIFLILTATFVGGCVGINPSPAFLPAAPVTPVQQTPQGYECTITDYGNNVVLFQCSSMTEQSFARSLSRYLGETNASVVGITSGANSLQSYIVVVER